VEPVTAAVWVTVAGLCVATAVIKAFGPLVFGGRGLSGVLARAIPLLAPALLAALVITETVSGTGRSLVIDARVGGLVVAAITIWRRWPLAVVVLCAAGATALLRAVG
jgi:branched-subunit amino acid transport protein